MQTDTSTIIVIDKSSWHSTFRRLLALAVHLLPVAILFPFWWFWHGRKLLQDDHKRATVAAKTATDAKTAKAGAGKTDSEDDQTRIVVVVESEPVSDSDMRLWWLHLAVSALQRCGPMYIKFGQWISSRTDILPPTVCKVFSKLQSNVTPHSFAVTRETVERDLLRGDKLETVFEWFEETPVGTGAVAQVHRAKLRNIPSLGSHAGQEVAVKVLHPNVESLIQADLGVLALVGSILSAVPGADLMSVTEEIELFGRMIERQLDLRIEAANLDRFAFNFGKSNPGVFLPVAVRPLVAARAMVETFVHGIPLRTIIERGPTVFDERVAVVGLRSFLKMVLHDNFCHADLHPGNVLVSFVRKQPSGSSFFGVSRTGNTASAYGSKHTGSTNNADPSVAPDVLPPAQLLQLASFKTVPEWRSALDALSQQGYEPRLVILDVGLVSELTPQNLDNVRECFKAGIDFDGVRLARLLTSRCKDPARVIDQKGVEAKMERMLNDVKFDSNGQLLLSRIHAVQIIQRFAAMVRQHEIGLDGDFVGLFVASIIIEGVGRTLKADLDLLEALADYL
ncbi:ABC1 family-domain-containing protein [Entophlyctis helioformis]|nr:ABC1 family-domain-containing protein [Entophlyctis helioformis]